MWLGISDYTAFVIAIIVLLALPGPGNLALILSTAKGGLRGGLAATLGIICGDQVWLWSAVLGLAALMTAVPEILVVVQVVGAAYLMYLGVQLLRATGTALPMITLTAGAYWRQGFFITLLNPKAIIFYWAFFPLFINPAHHQGAITFAAMAVTIAILTFLYGFITSSLTLLCADAISQRAYLRAWLERIAGVLLLGFGLHLLLDRFIAG